MKKLILQGLKCLVVLSVFFTSCERDGTSLITNEAVDEKDIISDGDGDEDQENEGMTEEMAEGMVDEKAVFLPKIELKGTVCEPFIAQIESISLEEERAMFRKDKKAFSDRIFRELNQFRISEGLPPFRRNRTARFFALQHNDYQISQKKISHDNHLLRFCSVMQIEQVSASSENVAFGFTTAKSVVRAWLKSPAHRKNIMRKFSRIGIGTTMSDTKVLYFTTIFIK